MAKVLDLETGGFNREQAEWTARKWIGYVLIGLLIGIVLAAMAALFAINHGPVDVASQVVADAYAADSKADAERLISVLNIIFAPITTLVGTIAGFYFGSKSAEGQG